MRSGGFQASYLSKFKFYSCKYFPEYIYVNKAVLIQNFQPHISANFRLVLLGLCLELNFTCTSSYMQRDNNLTPCMNPSLLYTSGLHSTCIFQAENIYYLLNKTYSAKMLACLREMKCYRPRTIYSILIYSSSHISATLFNYNFLY